MDVSVPAAAEAGQPIPASADISGTAPANQVRVLYQMDDPDFLSWMKYSRSYISQIIAGGYVDPQVHILNL